MQYFCSAHGQDNIIVLTLLLGELVSRKTVYIPMRAKKSFAVDLQAIESVGGGIESGGRDNSRSRYFQ